jgi:hypothetical protein
MKIRVLSLVFAAVMLLSLSASAATVSTAAESLSVAMAAAAINSKCQNRQAASRRPFSCAYEIYAPSEMHDK